jgi:hypothetical protein
LTPRVTREATRAAAFVAGVPWGVSSDVASVSRGCPLGARDPRSAGRGSPIEVKSEGYRIRSKSRM